MIKLVGGLGMKLGCVGGGLGMRLGCVGGGLGMRLGCSSVGSSLALVVVVGASNQLYFKGAEGSHELLRCCNQ